MEQDKLWDKYREGSESAFAQIYEQHVSLLVHYGSKMVSDTGLVEDCIQDLFVELWNRREHVSPTSSIKFYLFKALRYKILKSKRTNRFLEMEWIGNRNGLLKDSSFEDRCIEQEVQSFQMRHLSETLVKLPNRQSEAIHLRYFHNFSNDEIARIMGVSYRTACKLLYAGLKKLKENVRKSTWFLTVSCGFLIIDAGYLALGL